MLDINLIRWRSLQRYRNFSQLMFDLIIASLLASCFLWLLYKWLEQDINGQTEALQQNLDSLSNIKVVPQELRVSIADLHIYQQHYIKIKNIILSHAKTSQLFAILDDLLPANVTLTEMQYRDEKVWLKGTSYSNDDLSDFLVQLSKLTVFQNPQLNFSLQKTDWLSADLDQDQIQMKKRFELQVLFLGVSQNENESLKSKVK